MDSIKQHRVFCQLLSNNANIDGLNGYLEIDKIIFTEFVVIKSPD